MTATSTEVLSITYLDFEPALYCTMRTIDGPEWVCPNQATHRVVPSGRCAHTHDGFTCEQHVPIVQEMIDLQVAFSCNTCGFVLTLVSMVPL